MKKLLTAFLIVAMAWTAPAPERPRPATKPQYTLVELFGVMVVVGGLVYLNLWIRWKNAHSPTDSREIWPPDTNAIAGNIQGSSEPIEVGTVDAGDLAVVIHPDISSQGFVDTHGPVPTLFTSAFETVLQESDQSQIGYQPLYTVRGFVSANGVLTFLLKGSNYVAQSYGLLDASMCATNYFPRASIGTGAEASKFYRMAGSKNDLSRTPRALHALERMTQQSR